MKRRLLTLSIVFLVLTIPTTIAAQQSSGVRLDLTRIVRAHADKTIAPRGFVFAMLYAPPGNPPDRIRRGSGQVLVNADGTVTVTGLFQFGGTSASFPALKRSSTTLQVRLADDSDFADFAAKSVTVNGSGTSSVNIGDTDNSHFLKLLVGSNLSADRNFTIITGDAARTLTIIGDTTLPIASQTLTFSGPTAARTITVPDANFTAARTDAGQTFTGVNIFTSPKVITDISDTNGNELFKVTATGSAVNEFTVANATTGNGPTLSATGSDANIDLNITPKGTGTVNITGTGATQLRTTQSSAPTCSSNCGTSPSVAGTDTAMTVTMGASGSPASGFVITFNGTWAAAPSCVGVPALAGMAVGKLPIVIAATTTTITVTTNGTAPSTSDKYHFHCIGVQ